MSNQIPKNWQSSKFPFTINFIRYRSQGSQGNCFVNCLIQALTNLGDSNVIGKTRPELEVFDLETLNSPKPEGEFKPALNYLINKEYKVKIIDPEPHRNCNWGDNLAHIDLKTDNYTVKEVEDLSNDSWQVIISTEVDNQPHAVLVTKAYIYNPTNVQQWQKPESKSNNLITHHTNKKEERFLIAIKK